MGLKGRSRIQKQKSIKDMFWSKLKSLDHPSFSHALLIIIWSKFTILYEYILFC